jgi:hypothetical protein
MKKKKCKREKCIGCLSYRDHTSLVLKKGASLPLYQPVKVHYFTSLEVSNNQKNNEDYSLFDEGFT